MSKLSRHHIILVMDGDCALCSNGARLIAKFDKKDQFRIATAQSELGRTLLTENGQDPEGPASWLCVSGDDVSTSLPAVLFVAKKLGGVFTVLRPLGLLPLSFQHWIYERIARNRIRLFGRKDMCAIPSPELQRRIL